MSDVRMINAPTEVDHYQLRRVIDMYVSPQAKTWEVWPAKLIRYPQYEDPRNVRVTLRGLVEGMRQSFKSFGIGLSSRSFLFI